MEKSQQCQSSAVINVQYLKVESTFISNRVSETLNLVTVDSLLGSDGRRAAAGLKRSLVLYSRLRDVAIK